MEAATQLPPRQLDLAWHGEAALHGVPSGAIEQKSPALVPLALASGLAPHPATSSASAKLDAR